MTGKNQRCGGGAGTSELARNFCLEQGWRSEYPRYQFDYMITEQSAQGSCVLASRAPTRRANRGVTHTMCRSRHVGKPAPRALLHGDARPGGRLPFRIVSPVQTNKIPADSLAFLAVRFRIRNNQQLALQ